MAEKNSTPKDAKFIQLWSDAGFDPAMKSACAKSAGYSAAHASRSTGKIINSLIQNRKMQKELKKAGVDMKRLAEKIAQLIDAPNPLVKPWKDPVTGELIFAPDNFIQLKATELATRLHDAFAPARLDIDKRETKQIVFSAEVIHRLERFNSQRELLRSGETFDVEPIRDQQE